MTTTSIEWTDRVWNPIVGCSVLSPGCTNCYAMRMAARIQRMGGRGAEKYAGTTQDSKAGPVWTGKVNLDEDALLAPLRWKKPARIFVNSMSDLFHEHVMGEWIDRIFAVMALASQHTFQVLTKRADRMRDYFRDLDTRHTPDGNVSLSPRVSVISSFMTHSHGQTDMADPVEALNGPWPLPNVWLGVSVEDQRRADERIPALLTTPAAVRWISAEPLLGDVDLRCVAGGESGYFNSLSSLTGPNLDWVVAGGESGPGARPMHPDWARSLRDQCAAANVPYFFKQWGDWVSVSEVAGTGPHHYFPDGATVRRLNKRAAGHTLDGREHREWPRCPLS